MTSLGLRRALAVIAVFGLIVFGACRSIGVGDTTSIEPDSVAVLWAGAVTSTSAKVVARPPGGPSDVRLAVSSSGTWQDPAFVDGTRPSTNPEVLHFELQGLAPQTAYHYALSRSGQIDTSHAGRFRTFADGPFSFRVAMGACAETGSEHAVFNAIRASNPDLFLHLGDLHYENIARAEPDVFRNAFGLVHSSRTQSALFRSTALAYMWDDHDYGPNNSSRRARGQDAAQQVYREFVPHYELGPEERRQPIYQAFTVGRVRFLLTDLRSARTVSGAPDSLKTMMGETQKRWFKDQLVEARDEYPVIAWVSSVPWIAERSEGGDHWGGFGAERSELATYIDSLGVADQLVMLSGDAHMVALDDGTHNHYGRENGGGFPVVHAGALDRSGSVKGGPYTHGPHPNPFTLFRENDGQFVVMGVQDGGGDEVCVTWTGKRYDVASGDVVDLLEWEKCFRVP